MDDYFLDQFTEDHLNGGYGHVLDELAADEFAREHDGLDAEHHLDEPWDDLLAQQEFEDVEQCDEYFGCFGDEF